MAMTPAGFTGLLIFKYWVDIPIGDEWHVVSLLEEFALGTFSFQDLFAQQNEFRQFFPNLIFVALGWLTKWDVRFLMLLNLLLAGLISFNVYRLGRARAKHAARCWRWRIAVMEG